MVNNKQLGAYIHTVELNFFILLHHVYLCLLSFIKNENKMNTIQSVIVHDAFSKPKILLDRFRLGLNVLGFAEQLGKHPDVLKPLFVLDESSISYTELRRFSNFPKTWMNTKL